MRLLPWDPDIQTVIARIEAGSLNLQPDFQRGEVWTKVKKQRLVDSVLRDWHVPPIHVVENASTKLQEVLDGQQRLAAIRDFVRGEFTVDGTTEPYDESISKLDGRRYRDLPADMKLLFDNFTLRVYRIVDYKSAEPAELFFRLNQPTNLTGAEQRNAFFGPVREQIKKLVDHMSAFGLGKETLGFSNSRMSYDDILCRVALTLERKMIDLKMVSNDLVGLYRNEHPISYETEQQLYQTLELFGSACKLVKGPLKFNKATAYSWLVFVARGIREQHPAFSHPELIARFLDYFEAERVFAGLGSETDRERTEIPHWDWLFLTYDDRSTSRVADVSSIVLRDAIIWVTFSQFVSFTAPQNVEGLSASKLKSIFLSDSPLEEDVVVKKILDAGWGSL